MPLTVIQVFALLFEDVHEFLSCFLVTLQFIEKYFHSRFQLYIIEEFAFHEQMKPFDMIVKFKFKTEIVGKKPLYCTNITFSSGCRSIETLVFHASQKEQERWFLPSFVISDRLEVGAELRTLLKTPYSRDGFDYVFSIGNVRT